MADDRPDISPETALAGWEEQPEVTPEEEDAWVAENLEWIRAKVREAIDDPRPALTSEEVEARMRLRHTELLAKYGR